VVLEGVLGSKIELLRILRIEDIPDLAGTPFKS
jgi:hypothetical protein